MQLLCRAVGTLYSCAYGASNHSSPSCIYSSFLYEHVPGHGQHHRRSHRLGLPQTDADGADPLHP